MNSSAVAQVIFAPTFKTVSCSIYDKCLLCSTNPIPSLYEMAIGFLVGLVPGAPGSLSGVIGGVATTSGSYRCPG